MPDPIDQLAVQVAADNTVAKANKTPKKGAAAKKSAPAAQVGEIVDEDPLGVGNAPADATATTGDATESDASADNGEATSTVSAPEGEAAEDASIAEAAAPVPAAPGDDPESVFARRLERLTNIVADAEFESGTILGDLTECTVELFKARPMLWSAMDKNQQRDVVRHIEATMRLALDKIVLVMAQEDDLTVEGTLVGQFTVKGDAVEAKIKIDHVDSDGLLDVYRLAGHKIVLISADSKRFSSKRREPDTPGNQPGLPFADEEKPKPGAAIMSKPPEHPDDDSDLADEEDEDEEEVLVDDTRTHGDHSAINDEATELFGVFDEGRSEWLIDENGGDDGWTNDVKSAGKWPHGEATRLARAFDAADEPPLAVRLLYTPE